MSENKHTQGEWLYLDLGEVVLASNFEVTIATVDLSRDGAEADGTLIAAAPDMLAALHSAEVKLRRYMEIHGPRSPDPDLRDTYVGGLSAEYEASLCIIRAAISKAESQP